MKANKKKELKKETATTLKTQCFSKKGCFIKRNNAFKGWFYLVSSSTTIIILLDYFRACVAKLNILSLVRQTCIKISH